MEVIGFHNDVSQENLTVPDKVLFFLHPKTIHTFLLSPVRFFQLSATS